MLILHHGNIITCNPLEPIAEAIAIENDRIVAVGSNVDVIALMDSGSTQKNLNNQTVIPGLTDSHIHLEDYALSQNRINCDTSTKEECLRIVQEKVRTIQPGKWILGHGWDHNLWGFSLPSIQDLDKISPQNPVYLTGKSMHNAWINHRALELSSIQQNTGDPPGGRIERDIHGNFTGILLDNALLIVEKAVPIPSVEECILPFKSAIHNLNKMGITSIHDFDEIHCFKVINQLLSEKTLDLRVFKAIPRTFLDEAIFEGWQTGKGDDWLRVGPLKLFADGALGSRTALMIKPYDGFIQDKGLSLISRKELIQIGEKALKSGISLAIHAIGDQANRDVIKAFEYFRSFEINQKLNPSVLRIEHLQLIDPVDIPRLAEFRIVASMQPIHAPSDAPMADRLWGKRVGTSYAWKSIYDAGAMLIFGSDCPVESPNPIWGIYAAVARKRHEPSANSWHPEQCVNFMQALEAYTHNPSIISNQGNDLGMLKQGYLADLVFLSKNPLTTHSNELYNIKIDDVMLAGKWILPGPLSS